MLTHSWELDELPSQPPPSGYSSSRQLRRAGAPEPERLGRIDATTRTVARTASSFLSHPDTAIHDEPGHVVQASRRAGVRETAYGRNDEVLAEPK